MSSVSIVLIAYRMERELPRTVVSLLPGMQLDVEAIDYEIIVVDNGSPQPVSIDHPLVRVLRIDNAPASPALAVNMGIAQARGDLIGVMVDGARIASPGIVRFALAAARLHERPVIGTLGFHIGPDAQQRSVPKGYDQDVEDALLEEIRWPEDGYRLFEISSFALSSAGGWYAPIHESNALFMPRELWAELGGYDERFTSPGGGFVNLDAYERACSLPDSQLFTVLGEGTFHQVHGGVTTNGEASGHDLHAEYSRIRGRPLRAPQASPRYIGQLPATGDPA